MVDGMVEMARTEGVFAAPEGGATLAALKKLVEGGVVKRDERVILLVTGNAHKYLDVLPEGLSRRDREFAMTERGEKIDWFEGFPAPIID